MNKNILILLVLLLFNFGYGQTNTWTGAVNTAWENDLNWSLGVAPQALEDVVIPPAVNQPIISTAGVTCTTLTLGAGSSLTISASGTLAVIGEITITAPTFDNSITTLAVGSGTLAAGGITMEAAANDTRKCHLTIDTGTVNVAGNVTMTGSALQNNIAFTSIGSLNIGGTMTGGSLTPGIGEVNYNGPAAQVVGNYVYDNLTLSGAGVKTFDSAIAVNNTLSIVAGVVADLGTFIHSTFLLSLNGSNSTGTWGGVGSAAGNISPTFFAANSGIVNVGPPTVQASNLVFTNTTSTSTTINWTNGNGASRVVFVHAGASGSASPLNYFPYTANSVFGLGTEIGSSGWFCVYKGTGTTLDLTGLSLSTTYQVMTLEYNGSLGNELHLTDISTGNPAEVTTTAIGTNTIGPGGALTGLNLWLDASNGVSSTANNLTAWSDITAINTFAVSATPPTVTTNSINFHPTVNFNNSNPIATYPATQNLIGNTNITYVDAYAVFKVNNSNGGTVIGSTTAGNNYGRAVFSQSSSRMYMGNGTSSNLSYFPYTDYNNFHIFSMEKNTLTSAIGRLDAINQTMLNQGSYASFSFIPSVGTTNNNGSGSGWAHLNGQVAEVIVYNQSAATQKINIESYLALKYGIHKADNYVSSSDAVIWDATANAAYHNDVFGLGEDDLSGLNQSISNSMNTGSGDGTGQSGKGNIIINNPSALANNTFLIIGHNTSALTETNVVVGGNPTKRVQRIWKVQTTGNPGTIKLSYDISGLTYSAQEANDYVLLVDPTGTGDFSGGSVVPYTAVTLAGNKVSFDNVNLPTGAVFTFQTLAQPTIQATNVIFANTTGTSTTASWTNGNGSSRAVFMYAGTSGSPVPANNTTYTANTTFGTGTQIGTTGWFCVYNGTGTTVNITGLTPAATYQVMTVEYNGPLGSELYLSTVSTGNPAAVTTLNNIATLSNLSISEGTLDPVFDTATTSYIATVPNAVTSLTVTPTTTDTNATVTVNGLTVAGGSASDPISLTVGPNVITTIVTAQDGTTIETYTITVTRTEPTIVTTGTLSALTTIYGTPSVSGTFNVSGTDMAEGILITPPTGFEVSSDDLTFTNSITVGAAGIIASTPVYIRLKGTVPAGTYSGDIVLTSTNAATVNVATVSSTVTPAALTITADNKTKMYGDDNPTLTLSYSGFVNGDTVGSLTLAPITSTAAVTGSPVGDYTISVSGAANPNYTITYVDGTLTITKAVLTITADDKTKVYGATNPALTASYLGFVNGDTAANLITPPTISTTALDASPVGTYAITASGAVSDNYDFTYVNGNLTITKALLTITADDKTKVYGTANPALTASYSGFVNGDTATNLTTPPTITTTALDASPVGTYAITASGAVSDNYDFTYVNGNLTVTKALLTITADDQTKVYGEVNPTLTVSYSGFLNGDTSASLTTAPTITTTALDASPVGTYTITASGAVSDNYDFTYVNGNLTITKAVLTITGDDKTKVYGTVNPTLTASYSGFVNGDTSASLTTAPTITTIGDDASPVGTYIITPSGAVSDNYDFTYVNGNLTITKALLTITADDKTKVYGTANPALTASYLGFVNGDTAANLITIPTISTTALDASPVGTYTITASGAVSDNYDFTYVNGTLTITKALLTITADDKTKVYGAVNPTLTASYSGFVNGDTAANLTTPPTITTIADDTSPVGTYTITASGAVSDNYDFTYVNGTLTITKALLTITADDKTKVYGAVNPTLTASYSGFVNGDTAANLTTPPTITTIADDTSPVGTYTITASGAVSDNYDFTYVNGTLTITKALLTITADDKTKVYGEANPTLTASYSGFVNGDTSVSLITLPTITTIADTTSPVGTYTITASGAVSDNYDFTYVNGNLTITKALLTITADDKTKVYGEANPTLTASYSGFLNGDRSASLTTLPTISTIADDTSPVGTYTITASGAVSDNYDFTYVNGNLTITKALLTITADDQTKVYGSVNPALTASYLGFVNGDTATNLTTAPTISTAALDASPVGTYAITASGAVSDNYDFTYVNGNLTITKALLTITADDKTKVYGSANPSLTASYLGFVNGETSASLTTLPTITTTALDASPVGTYTITPSGAVSDNYDFTYVNGTLTITKALLTITADNQTKVYGTANPALTASYSGFVNGDTSSSLITQPTISTIADDTSPVGTYAIMVSGAASDNYTINYIDGTLTITGATLLTIIANNQSKIYGEANPTLTVSYVGFVNGDTEASLTTLPTITTTAVQSSPVGTYPITASGAVNPNYTISYVPGVLTVTPANLAIAADDKTKIYGEANPPLTLNYTGFVNGDTEASLLTPAIASTTADVTSPVGSYPITISGATSLNYTIGYTSGATLTITPANLAIAADDKFKIYGEANPPLTLNYTGFVNGDTEANLLTPAIASTTADAASPVGSYPITISGATSLNYTIGYTSGATLTVTPANLTITADNQSKTYGSVNPTLTASYSGFVNGDTAASFTTLPNISTTAVTGSTVGTYPITASGAANPNYAINYIDGTLTITTATLTITADNQTKTYGSVNPTLTATYSGFVNGDTAASFTTLPTVSTTAVTGSTVGTYPITASGAANPNYAINYIDGTLTVTTATLTITADNQNKTYGSVNPALTATYSGFVNGDTAASFTTLPTISTIVDATSPVGTYPITASGAVNPNYVINYVDGTLTVTTATLTITADNQTKIYGSVNPALTATYSGFVNGDTEASLTTLPTITTTAVQSSPVGTYPIKASGAVNPNYAIIYVDGTLTITTTTLTITADNQTKTYGSVNPTLTATYSGFVNGDTASSFTTLPTISTTAVTGSNVGNYPITASGAVNPNYAINYVDGTLTVTTATLTITADNLTKTYGSVNPTLTATYSGFVNGDTAASFTTLPTISTTAVTGSNVGIYQITASGAVNPNYTISYFNGTLTVTTASLTITADNKTRDYGAPNPVLTANYSGFVNGDTSASLTTQPIIATIANATSPVGVYAITVSGAVGANYNITYVTGVLTIVSPTDLNLASLTVNNGTLNPAFSPNVLLYTVNVASTISSETITAIADDPLATITINGITVQSGSPYTIALVPGQNTVVIRVVGEDGITTKSYTLNIIREKSGIATLSNLTISEGTLNPVFESDINNYSAVVKYDVASINVRPTATDLGSKITVNGLPVSSGTFSAPVTLIAGENIIETIVTPQDGITKVTYTIIVYKGISPDQLVVNNILSPNGDGKNDFWVIKDIELFPNNMVTVYDRAGRIVYSKKSYSNEWDGSYSGSPLNNDTYYYLIDLGDNLPKIKGFITMLRD